jgi:hypothetical protein
MNIQPSVTEYKPLSVPDDALKLEVAFCVRGVLSPLLSNIVLDELDQEMARRGYRFVRYADDANIYVQSPRAGQRVMASISRFIERRLRLKVNTTKSTVTKPERSHFLGFRLRRQSTDGTVAVMLSKRSVDRIYEAIRSKTPRSWGQSLDACIEDLNRYLRGWIGFFRIVTPAAFTTLSDLDAHVRRRLRAIVLRHWRRKRVIIRRLIRRRVPESLVRRAVLNGRRSWWALSHTRRRRPGPVDSVLPVARPVLVGRVLAGRTSGTRRHGHRSHSVLIAMGIGFRRAGCETRTSGSVRAGGGQLPSATRPAVANGRRIPSTSTLSARSGVTASRRCLHQTSLRSPADHDDSCELPPREGGGSPNQCFGHSRTRTNANTGIPAHTPLLRLARQATTAEFRVVDVIAQHDPEPNPQRPRRRDVGLRESLLRHLPSIEALQVRIASHGVGRRLAPKKPQKRVALFAERAQSLTCTARVLARDHADVAGDRLSVGKSSRVAYEDFRGQCGHGPDARMGHE